MITAYTDKSYTYVSVCAWGNGVSDGEVRSGPGGEGGGISPHTHCTHAPVPPSFIHRR